MPSFCAVVNCSNRGDRDRKSFFRFPAIPKNASEKRKDLIAKRRKGWLLALRRAGITESKITHLRICEDHFITGKPADIKDLEHPDWLPSVKMGYEKNSETAYPFNAYTKKVKIVNCFDEKDETSLWQKRLLIDGEININSSEATSFQNKTITSLKNLRPVLWSENICMIDTSVGSKWTSPSINDIFETNENNSKNVNTNVDLITDQNLSSVKENFTFQFLLKNVSLIKKPNYFWGVSPHSNIIICARWSEDYICEKRVVIENSLIVRAFLKKWEVNLSELMKITCIDDISNLLQKVESY